MKNYNTLGANTGGLDGNGKWTGKDLNSQWKQIRKRHHRKEISQPKNKEGGKITWVSLNLEQRAAATPTQC